MNAIGTSSATGAAAARAPSSTRVNDRSRTGSAYPRPKRGCSGVRAGGRGSCGDKSVAPVLNVAPPEATLDAQVAAGDGVIERRRHPHDFVVLDVELEGASDAAIRADGLGHVLATLVPGARIPV